MLLKSSMFLSSAAFYLYTGIYILKDKVKVDLVKQLTDYLL